jgi:hypothetical protein
MKAGDPPSTFVLSPGLNSLRIVEAAGSEVDVVLQGTNATATFAAECHWQA